MLKGAAIVYSRPLPLLGMRDHTINKAAPSFIPYISLFFTHS